MVLSLSVQIPNAYRREGRISHLCSILYNSLVRMKENKVLLLYKLMLVEFVDQGGDICIVCAQKGPKICEMRSNFSDVALDALNK